MGQGISLKRERNKYFHIEFCDFFKISKQILDFYDKSTNIVVIKKSFLSLIFNQFCLAYETCFEHQCKFCSDPKNKEVPKQDDI